MCEFAEQTPLHEEVEVRYDEESEPVRHAEYAVDVALRNWNDVYEPHSLFAFGDPESDPSGLVTLI